MNSRFQNITALKLSITYLIIFEVRRAYILRALSETLILHNDYRLEGQSSVVFG